MIQLLPKLVTFAEFVAWYPEGTEQRYELHDGAIVEMPKPTGKHSKIAGFLIAELNLIIRQFQLPYFIPKACVIKTLDESGYEPDVVVLDETAIADEPFWEKDSVITRAATIKLLVEVVSTNWRDDYLTKLADYEELGIPEYWVVDYLGLGGRRFIDNPKQPTFSVYELVEREYQVSQFSEVAKIQSPTFATLNLAAEQVFAGKY
jgi:Uma2 family endonuclease